MKNCAVSTCTTYHTFCCAAFALVAALILLLDRSLFTVDTWWHIALGDQIRALRSIPPETFSFTAHGQPIFCHWWLSDVIFSLVVAAGGLNALEAFGFLLVILICIMVGAAARSLHASWSCVYAAELAFFFIAQRFLIIRPQLFSALLVLWIFILYMRYRERPSARFMFIPLLFVVWSNLHGGFLFGLLVLFSFLVFEIAAAAIERTGFSRAKTLALVFVLSVAASLLNPYGLAAFSNALQHDPFVQGANQHIDEWLAPSFTNSPWLFLAIILALILALTRRAKPSALEACIFMGATAAALSSWRHAMVFGIFAVPILAAWACRALDSSEDIRAAGARKFIPALTVLSFSAIFCWQLFLRVDVLCSPRVRKAFPVAAAAWVLQHPQQGNMFNPYDWGGYLIYALRGNPPVYIDSRLAPFLEIFPDEYFKIFELREGWQDALKHQSITWMLLGSASALREKLETSEGWIRLYGDETATILKAPGN